MFLWFNDGLNINYFFYLTRNTKGEQISHVPRRLYFQKHGTLKCFLQEVFSRNK